MTDYEKEKQERRARWKKRRRKQTIRNLTLCGVAIGVIVACIICIVILSNRIHSKETVGKSVESGKIIKANKYVGFSSSSNSYNIISN